jgi:NADH-quinone oxidoreductase subunit E
MSSALGIIGKDTFVSYESFLGSKPTPITREMTSKLKDYVNKYPSKKSAVMPGLYLAQEHFGWICKEAITWVSSELSVPPAHVESVATFYTMYYKRPVGKYHIQLCRTLSCMLCGAKKLAEHLKETLKVGPAEVTSDGMWSWEEVECLGSCGSAPMVQINDVFFEFLTPESLDALMTKIKAELPDLRYHASTEELGKGMADHPRSKILGNS